MDAPAKLTRQTVVSCFIFKTLSPPTVALFRRSAKVNTYQHKLAAISGTVEPTDSSPLAAAWRELQEETTLTRDSLYLRRQGKPYTFTDEQLSREWTIFPFAFELISPETGGKVEDGIVTDWEHEAWAWYDARTVRDEEDFGGVPHLATSLRRAWFEYDLGEGPGRILSSGLKVLREDHESGARVLAGKALDILVDVMTSLAAESRDRWWRDTRAAAWHLWKNGRESMGAAILNVVVACLRRVESDVLPRWDGLTESDRQDAIRQNMHEYSETRRGLGGDILRSFRLLLELIFRSRDPLRILTLSASSTVTDCLVGAVKHSPFKLDLRVLETRPFFEGALVAAKIAEAMADAKSSPTGVRTSSVTVYTDAAAAHAAVDVDVVLLGADIISASGDICNKTGSLPAVLVAKHVSPKAQVIIVADREKIYPFAPPEYEENDEAEVTGTWSTVGPVAPAARVIRDAPNSVVRVENIYFEWVDSGLIDHYVLGGLDDAIITATDISERAEEVKKSVDHFFADL